MEKLSYTTEFTLWPVPHARPLIDGKPEPGAHPAEYLHPGKLHLETSDDNYVDLYIVPPLFKPGCPPGYQFYADLIFSNIYIAQDLQFYYRAFHDELQFAVSSDTIWQNRDHQYAVAIVDKDLNLSWTLRDSDPLRMEFIETVINTIHASMFKMPPILAEGEYMEFMNERNILDSAHLCCGDRVLRAIDVKAHTNDPVRVLTETDYSAVIRGTVYPSARLIWSVPLEDARYWHNAYNVLTVDPVIGAKIPADVRAILEHLPAAPAYTQGHS